MTIDVSGLNARIQALEALVLRKVEDYDRNMVSRKDLAELEVKLLGALAGLSTRVEKLGDKIDHGSDTTTERLFKVDGQFIAWAALLITILLQILPHLNLR